ncbi:MAG: segregation/condensation protein A [Terracidiphilus sp.]
MEEKTVPWWRRALNIALDGIRSGFGLFARPTKSEPITEPKFSGSLEESPEEAALTKPSPQPETEAIAEEIAADPAVQLLPDSERDFSPEPFSESKFARDSAEVADLVSSPGQAMEDAVFIDAITDGVEEASEKGATESGFSEEHMAEVESRVDPVQAVVGVEAPTCSSEPEAETESIPRPANELEVDPEPEVVVAPESVIEEITPPVGVTESILETEPEAAVVADEKAAAEAEPDDAKTAEVEAVIESLPKVVEFAENIVQVELEHSAKPALETQTISVPESVFVVSSEPELEAVPETSTEPADTIESVAEDAAEVAQATEAEETTESGREPIENAKPAGEVAAVIIEETAETEFQREAVLDPSENGPGAAAAETEMEPEVVAEPPTFEDPIVDSEPELNPEPCSGSAIEQAVLAADLPSFPPSIPSSVAQSEASHELTPGTESKSVERSVPDNLLVLSPQPTAEEIAEEKLDEKTAAKLAARQKKLDESSEQSPFSVIVGRVYDGPLDLLLDLIRKQDIDIYDIPIARLTAQFLAYVNQLKASDVDVAGDFIYTASLLIHIKSRMLLPRADSGPEDAAEDPRRELVERLLEHERFKNAAQMLQQKQVLEAATWSNPGAREFKDDEAAEPDIAADTVDLVRIFRDILERARSRPAFNVEEDSVTVGQMIQFLGRRLTMEDKPIALRRLLSHTHSERALIAMFLALLEMVRLQAILLRQDRVFSEIFVKKHTGFDAAISEGLMNTSDDWR